MNPSLRGGAIVAITGERRGQVDLSRWRARSYPGASVLLLDEPTSALDDELERRVVDVCRDHRERGGLIIVATHREDFLRHADCVLELRDGTVIEWERRTAEPLLH